MQKLFLISIILTTLFLPAAAARSRDGHQALRSVLAAMAVVEICYAIFLFFFFKFG